MLPVDDGSRRIDPDLSPVLNGQMRIALQRLRRTSNDPA
jgi:hypothetical protein